MYIVCGEISARLGTACALITYESGGRKRVELDSPPLRSFKDLSLLPFVPHYRRLTHIVGVHLYDGYVDEQGEKEV